MASNKNGFLCSICERMYNHASNLRRHVRLTHKDQYHEVMKDIDKNSKLAYRCSLCPRAYSKASNLRYHERKVHCVGTAKRPSIRCPLCMFVGQSSSEFESHLSSEHEINLVKTEHLFDSESVFLEWKQQLEKDTTTRYVKFSGKKPNQTYKCFRSGVFHSKGRGLRSLKRTGSNKIDGYCPAGLKVKSEVGGKLSVTFTETHVGHSNDTPGLKIYPKEREEIAAKIAARVSFDEILEDLHTKGGPNLTRKDLYNIMNCFKLSPRESVSSMNVDAWVNRLAESNEWILVYKPEGATVDQYPSVKVDDFLLIVMNEQEKDPLSAFGSNLICLESVNPGGKVNHLMILVVIDGMGQPVPCAFLFTSRSDQDILEIFFDTVRIQVGRLKPYILLSDVQENIMAAWNNIMDSPQIRLWSPWLVDEDWRKKMEAIPDKAKQIEMYKILRALMEEQDSVAFNLMMDQACGLFCTDQDYKEFGKYFRGTYCKNAKYWAQCYRRQAGLAGEPYLERVHQTVKHIYLNKDTPRRPDKVVVDVTKFMKDRVAAQTATTSAVPESELAATTKIVCAGHEAAALEFHPFSVIPVTSSAWLVPSQDTERIYRVVEVKPECFCKLTCEECQFCVHRYWCNCVESIAKWTMCKHMHCVGLYRSMMATLGPSTLELETIPSIDPVPSSYPMREDDLDSIPDSASLLLGLSRHKKPDNSLTAGLKERFDHLLKYVLTAEHCAEVEVALSKAEKAIGVKPLSRSSSPELE